ncbi:MAG: RNA polymerase sigma factor, partial [Planctomycetota bacterium]
MTDSLPTPADLRWLSGLARALLRDAHAADDLVQDTVVAALERPRPSDASPRAWLGGVARRLALRQRRGDLRRGDREWLVARSEVLPDSSELVERLDSAERLTAAVRSLPEPYRRVLLLRFLDDREPSWIAECDGAPVDTVRRRIRRGLELLREDLDRDARSRGLRWSCLLLPLTQDSQPIAASASGGTVASITAVKSLLVVFAISTAALVFTNPLGLEWNRERHSPGPAVAAPLRGKPATARLQMGPTDSGGQTATRVWGSPPTQRQVVVAAPTTQSSPLSVSPRTVTGVHGVVQDTAGRPIFGALVAIGAERRPFVARPPSSDSVDEATSSLTMELPRAARDWVRTDQRGRFWLERTGFIAMPPEFGGRGLTGYESLWVRANGYLQRVLSSSELASSPDGLRVILDRGRTLRGRLVSESGRPLAGVPLLALPSDSEAASLSSPSTLRMLSGERGLASSGSRTADSQGETDATGEFVLSGLPEGALTLVTLDPALDIVNGTVGEDYTGYREWTAHRCLGARVEVIGGPDLSTETLEASFRISFGFEDGGLRQLRGVDKALRATGIGAVDFRFDSRAIPGLVGSMFEGRRVVSARVHGTVGLSGLWSDWNAPLIDDLRGIGGLVVVEHPVSGLDGLAKPRGGWPEEEQELALLVLDLRYPNGTPVMVEVSGTWTSSSPDREPVTQKFSRRPTRLGRVELGVEPGHVEVTLTSVGTSALGSTSAGPVACSWGNRSDLVVPVIAGGSATLSRPGGWTGEWSIRSRYR